MGPSAFDELRFRLLTRNTAVRYDAYAVHTEQTLNGILSPLDGLLKDHLGFTSGNAIVLSKAVQELAEEQLSNILERAQEARAEWIAAIDEFASEGIIPEKFPREMLEYGAGLNSEARIEWATQMASTWAATFLGYELLFTAEDLSEKASVPIQQTQAFIERMALYFGDVDPQWYREPSATPPLQVRPLVRLRPDENPIGDHEGFFCPVPQSLLWALRNNIEAALNPTGSREYASLRLPTASQDTWNRYEQSRSSYTEDRAMQLLSELLPEATTFKNLKYEAPDRQGDIAETELDGLLLSDDSLFLVEMKAGSLTPPARRGAPSLEEELDEIIRRGHEQALRAQSYIESHEDPTFRIQNGTEWTVPKDDISRIFLIVVSLEDLSTFGPNLHDLNRADLLEDGDWPWCVSLTDLEVVAELLDFPSEFIHFLKSRLSVAAEGKIMAVDELDWLGCYLESGFNFKTDDLGDRIDWMQLGPTFTTEMDDYFMYKYGARKKETSKPSQLLPTPLREIILEIEDERPDGFYQMTEIILDFPHNIREKMADRMFTAREIGAGKGEPSGASFPNPITNAGLTYLIWPFGTDVGELTQELNGICHLRKYREEADRWLGLGYVIDGTSKWVHIITFNDEPWERNPELEEKIDEFPDSVRHFLNADDKESAA